MKSVLLFLSVCFSVVLSAQTKEALMEEGRVLEGEFKIEEALKKYETALQQDADFVPALVRASRMTSNIAAHIKDLPKRKEQLAIAEKYSKRAVALNADNPDAHFSLLVVLGLQSEIAPSPREKLKDAKLIKSEADKIISLDPKYALGYFVLGKWHYELSKLTWVERVACDLFYGGVPEGVSMEESFKNFNIALKLDPDQIIILYGKAAALHYEGKDQEAIRILERAITLPLRDVDDEFRKERCRNLLKEIKD
jgi:tetratricopeptide (TPR) repeat protein